MKICIIGAGVAGLQTLKILSDDYECHIFDKKEEPGGVWYENYDGYSLQVPKELYEFVGFPSKEKKGTFPSGESVQKYINDYVQHYELRKKSIFHMKETIDTIIKLPNDKWNVVSTKKSYEFDYCIICTGMYNTPHIPEEYEFEETLHTSEFVDASIVKDKNVLVIGGGKSSIDCAFESTKYAKEVCIYSRELHWPVPRLVLNIIPFKFLTYSRLGHFLLPKHWNITDEENKWHDRFKSLKEFAFGLLEKVFSIQFGLKEVPKNSLVKDLFNGGQILNYDYYNCINNGTIKKIKKDEVDSCIEKSDVIICGTGFTKDYSIFHDSESLGVEKDGLWLYKNIIHPNIENLAFIGSEVSTFNNILTQYVQAKWLKYHLDNEGLETDVVPSRKLMNDYIENEKKWKRSWMLNTKERSSLVQLHMTKYHDILMEDMKIQKVKNKLWNWLSPITSMDFVF
tara:strand:- start:1372 stop:2733 length:1362 start_codon:yes stop_codon:yes gene_type:complete